MERDRQNYLIFNSNDLLKLSLICFTVMHTIRILIEAPYALLVFNKGILLFCGTLLILVLNIVCIVISLYVFFRVIVQIFIPKSDMNQNDHTSITFFSLFLYALGHLFLLFLCIYCTGDTDFLFCLVVTLPILFYSFINLIGAVFIFILKIIKKIILFFIDKEDKSNERKFMFSHFFMSKKFCYFNKLLNYITFFSIFYLLIATTVLPIALPLLGIKWFIIVCWGYLLNFIGAIILYMLFYLRNNHHDDRNKEEHN